MTYTEPTFAATRNVSTSNLIGPGGTIFVHLQTSPDVLKIDFNGHNSYEWKLSVAALRNSQQPFEETLPDLFTQMHYQVVTEKFSYYLKQAGLVGFKLHSLRHTFATKLVALGVDLYTISRLLGHTDIKTTMIYAKTNIVSMQSAVDKLENRGNEMVTFPPK